MPRAGGEQVVRALEGLITATGAQVAVAPLPRVRADRDQLALVFENLLTNAMRYGRNGDRPEVSVAGANDRDGWHFIVSERGPGVAPADPRHIFELFGRAAAEQRRGTGIGLALCKTIVETHGGHIWVESEPGRRLPLHVALSAVLSGLDDD